MNYQKVAKAYLVQSAELSPAEFLAQTPNEVVFGRLDTKKNELYVSTFLGRGDLVNKKGIVITNESIPRLENRWIGAYHVLLESGKHIPYYIPNNVMAMSSDDREMFFKKQALPHSIGPYVDAFHITDPNGIHNLYGTFKTRHPIAVQKYIEKKFPRYTSSSILANKTDGNHRIYDWTPIDNTSVHNPANGMTLAEIAGSCSCLSGDRGGSSCISKLKTELQNKKLEVEVAQSSLDHGEDCIEKGFDNNKNYFESNNAHYLFLAQSSIMSQSEGTADTGQANAAQTPAGEGQQAGAPVANNQNQNQETQTQTRTQGKGDFNKRDSPANSKDMADVAKLFEGSTEQEKPEGENKEGEDDTKKDEAKLDYKALYETEVKQRKTYEREVNPKLKEYDNAVAIVKQNERVKAVTTKINELAKGKMTEERREELINHYSGEIFKSIEDHKALVKLVEKEFELMLTPKIKQSGIELPEPSDISRKFVAQSGKDENEDEKEEPVDIAEIGRYLS